MKAAASASRRSWAGTIILGSASRRSWAGRGDVAPQAQQLESSAEESARFRAVRLLVLIVIAVQNCSLMMVTGYSRSLPGPRYLASTAVVAGELVKTVVVLSTLLYQHGACGAQQVIFSDVLSRKSQTGRFAIPAFFYTVQNNLWYYAMSNLDPVTAAVTSQLKVLSTAVFSVLILQKQLTHRKWFVLGTLVLGLVVMQLPSSGTDAAQPAEVARPGAGDGNHYAMGLLCMVAACTSSGYAGVYLERLFKELNVSIWISNMQLQVFCMPIAMLTVVSDLPKVQEEGGLLHGWDGLTCVVVLLNALGGFAVSLTMKYADNILKTFAVSVSLVMNCLLSSIFMSARLNEQAMLGVAMVIASTWLYNSGGSSGSGAPRETSSQYAMAKQDSMPLSLEVLTGEDSMSSAGDLEVAGPTRSSSVLLGAGAGSMGRVPSKVSPTGGQATARLTAPRVSQSPPATPEAVPLGRLTSPVNGDDEEELRQLLDESPVHVRAQSASSGIFTGFTGFFRGKEDSANFLAVNSVSSGGESSSTSGSGWHRHHSG